MACLCVCVCVCVPQVIMLVQTDVTPRVELENKLADLTDAQLSMLEQLFPRHIIEYMLAGVPSKGGRNLRELANTHEQVRLRSLCNSHAYSVQRCSYVCRHAEVVRSRAR